MSAIPNAFIMSVVARHHIAEFHAEAGCERLARLATNHRGAERRLPWADLAVVAIVTALALLAAGSAVVEPTPQENRPRLVGADERAVTQVVDERLLDPIAVGQINAAWL